MGGNDGRVSDRGSVQPLPQHQGDVPQAIPVGRGRSGFSVRNLGLALAGIRNIEGIRLSAIIPQSVRRVGVLIGRAIRSPPVVRAQNSAKQLERQLVYAAYQERLAATMRADPNIPRVGGRLNIPIIQARVLDGLQNEAVLQGKIEQQIEQRLKADGQPINRQHVSAAAQRIVSGLAEERTPAALRANLFQSGITLSDDSFEQLYTELSRDVLIDDGAKQRAARELAGHIATIDGLLQGNPANFKEANQAILQEVRKALNSKAYLHLKEMENHPAVRLLHDLANSSYLEASVMRAYEQLNTEVSAAGDPLPENGLASTQLADRLLQRWEHLYQGGIFRSDMNSPFYLLTHPGSARGAFQSGKVGMGYDPHGALENQSGAAFDEQVQLADGMRANIRHFFTPSWRLDVDPPPEAVACLQSMTNRQRLRDLGRPISNDDHTAVQVCYNNLMEIGRGTEGRSSVNIMMLNRRFPDVFRGMTIPCDSQFHRRGLGHGSGMMDRIYTGGHQPRTAANFASALRDVISDDRCFRLGGRNERDDPGYYFHTRSPAEVEGWKAQIRAICTDLHAKYDVLVDSDRQPDDDGVASLSEIQAKIANNPASLTPAEKKKWWMLESAMIEEANLMLTTLNQARGLADLQARQQPVHQAMTSVCKELADRGQNNTTEKAYALCGGANNYLSTGELGAMMAMKNGRPMMARYRLPLSHREVFGRAFFTYCRPTELRQAKTAVFERVLGQGSAAVPGLHVIRERNQPIPGAAAAA